MVTKPKKKGVKAKVSSAKHGDKGSPTKKKKAVGKDGDDDKGDKEKRPKKAKTAKPVSKQKGDDAEDPMEIDSEHEKVAPKPKPKPKPKPVGKAAKGEGDEPAKKKLKKTGD